MNNTIQVFDYADIAMLRRMVRTHSTASLPDGYLLTVYKNLDRDKMYFIGVISSSEEDGTNNAITIVDPSTEKPVAELRSSRMPLLDLYKSLCYIMTELTPNAILCIEKRNVDIVLLHKLEDSDFKDNIYTESDVKGKDGAKRGMYLNRKERNTMFEIIKGFVRLDKEKIVTSFITEDISKAVYSKNYIECGNSLMSYLLALHVMRYGTIFNRLRELSLNEIPKPTELKTIDRDELSHGNRGVILAAGETSKHINKSDDQLSSDSHRVLAPSVTTNIDTPKTVDPVKEQDELIQSVQETQEEAPIEYYGALQFVKARPRMRHLQEGFTVTTDENPDSPLFKSVNTWMSKDTFENSFTRNGEFSFSYALEALKQGLKVARSGWNGTDMYITLIKAGNAAHKGFPMQDCLALKNNRGEMQPGWVPSQGDLLALDWRIVK